LQSRPKKEFQIFFQRFKKLKHPTLTDKKQNNNDCKTTGGQGFNSKKRKYASSQHWLSYIAVHSKFHHLSSQ